MSRPPPNTAAKAWAGACTSLRSYETDGQIASGDVLDQLIEWRMSDLRYYTSTHNKGQGIMQRQWTIEARADFADKDKNETITQAVREAAVHINAVLALLSDGQKPQVVAFSDDFFAGHEDIALLPDTLGMAIKEHNGGAAAEPISDEMAQAFRDMQHDKAE